MDNQQALQILKCHNSNCSGCDRLCNDLCKPAIEIAISALEKQIQEKSKKINPCKNEAILIDYIINVMHWCPFKDKADFDSEKECVEFGEVGCGECILKNIDKLEAEENETD